MKKYKIGIAVTLTLAMMLTFSGCTTFDNFKAAFIDKPSDKNTTLTIGVYEPMSGADKEDASKELEGIELAHELYPNVNGKVIELEYADNYSDLDAAQTAIETLISKEPKVILGSCGSVYSLVAGDYINKAQIPTIAMTNTNPLVTKKYKYYMRVCYVDSNQGALLARYVLEDKELTEAGILVPENDDAALAMATEFSNKMEAETDNKNAIIAYETYQTGDKNFKNQLNTIKKSGAQCVLLAGNAQDSVKIINMAADMNLDVEFLGGTEWGDKEFCKGLADNVKAGQLSFVQFFSADAEDDNEAVSEQRQKFLDAYHAKHGNSAEPEDAVALGFDAYFVAVDAIDKAPDDADGSEIAKILMDPQYAFDGATGNINFSSIGDPIKTAYVSTWAGGNIVTLYTVNPEE